MAEPLGHLGQRGAARPQPFERISGHEAPAPQRVLGNPRSMADVAGSGHRLVTTLVRV